MLCSVCQGTKKITLSLYGEPEVLESGDGLPEMVGVKIFPCPECVPMVPYKRVRAMKVVTVYPAEDYGRLQVPIERGLAARFGEYLMREGLIKFTTKGSADFGASADKVTITAHLGVVNATDVERADAEPEIARTSAPQIAREKLGKRRGRRWSPPALINVSNDEPVTDEFDEPRDAVAARFGGLEFG